MGKFIQSIALLSSLIILVGCGSGISGMVRLVDHNNQPIPNASSGGIVVNMINTSLPIEKASYSVQTDNSGGFKTESGKVESGLYKIEASKTGYVTETKTIRVDGSAKVTLDLKKIPSKSRRSYRSSRSDRDKIVNPGEVNIQPPSM